MTEVNEATIEPINGEQKDRNRKVRKKFSRKEPCSETQSNADSRPVFDSPGLRCENQESRTLDDPCDVCIEQLEDVIFRSLKNSDGRHSPTDFITSKSSSFSDLAELLFFDDLSSTANEEEFKVVQRKKKIKANCLQDQEQVVCNKLNDIRINKLEKCKELIEQQVVVRNITKPTLRSGLKSFDSFSNSVSLSTFASQSSSVRSTSPVSTSGRNDSVMCELPISPADAAGVSNDETVDFYFIPSVTSCNLGNELINRRTKATDKQIICDLVSSGKIADGKLSFCHQCASPQLSGVFVSDAGYPDIVTSTISEFPVSRSLEAFRWIAGIKPIVSLPQPGDIMEHMVNYSCLIEIGSTLSDGDSRSTLESKGAIVFGDFSSSELKPQDIRCDTKSTAELINFEYPMSYSRLRSSRCQVRARMRHEVTALKTQDRGMCSNPVIFFNCMADETCDPEISFGFGFDSIGDEEEYDSHASAGFLKTDVGTGDYQWSTCLPDVVDPAVIQRGSNLVAEFAATTASFFDPYDVQSLKGELKSPLLNGVECQASLLSARTDSSAVCNSTMETLEKPCVSRKWNKHSDMAKNNSHPSWYDRSEGFHMRKNSNHGHLTASQSENQQKKITIVNSWMCRAGKFNLHSAQDFLWKSFQETLEDKECVYMQ